jgi:hypothetical protein
MTSYKLGLTSQYKNEVNVKTTKDWEGDIFELPCIVSEWGKHEYKEYQHNSNV